jgi:hypothetical protein
VPEIRVELIIDGRQAKQQLELLRARTDELVASIGTPLTFHMAEGGKSAKITFVETVTFETAQNGMRLLSGSQNIFSSFLTPSGR